MADANLSKLVKKLERFIGHPATDIAAPAVIPAAGVFDRDDLEDVMNDHRWDAVRYALSYSLSQNMSGAKSVWTGATFWADDVVLQTWSWQVVVPDTPEPLIGRWSFNNPQVYPLYLTGRTFDLHAAAADLLESWASKLKLQYQLQIGDLRLFRNQQYDMLMKAAEEHRNQTRIISVRVANDDTLRQPGQSKNAYREATAPPPM